MKYFSYLIIQRAELSKTLITSVLSWSLSQYLFSIFSAFIDIAAITRKLSYKQLVIAFAGTVGKHILIAKLTSSILEYLKPRPNVRVIFIVAITCFGYSIYGQTPDPASTIQLQQVFEKDLKDDEPGGVILISKNHEVVFSSSMGLADLDTKEPITVNTVFNTGSISKTFVSNGILILQERGLLSLDDPISKYFDDFSNPDLITDIKIYHLLSHSSGLPDIRNVSSDPDFYLTAKDEENFAPIKRVASLNFRPGEEFEYSNPAYNGLALIIEKVSGQPWQEFIIENIFQPAGMSTSKITIGPHPRTGVAHGYVKNGSEYHENDYGEVPTFAASGNGGVWSSVIELMRYEQALCEGRIISQELLETSRMPVRHQNWNEADPPHVGYSWFTRSEKLIGTDLEVDVVYHTGSQGGFRAFHISIPEKKLLFVGLFNKPINNMNKIMRTTLLLLKEEHWLE